MVDLLKLVLLTVTVALVVSGSHGVKLTEKQKTFIAKMVTKFVNSNGECGTVYLPIKTLYTQLQVKSAVE